MNTKKIKSIVKHRKGLWNLRGEYSFFLDRPVATNFGSVNNTEAEALKRVVEIDNGFDGPMIEVGTLFGHTAQLIASCKTPDMQLFTIDNYSWNPFQLSPNHHREFTLNSLRIASERHHVRIVDSRSTAFFSLFHGNPPSLVFLEGAHDYSTVKSEIEFAKSLGAHAIAGHDYKSEHPVLVKAVDESFKKVDLFDSLWGDAAAGVRS